MFKEVLVFAAVAYLAQGAATGNYINAILDYKPVINDLKIQITEIVSQRIQSQSLVSSTVSNAIRQANEAINSQISNLNSIVNIARSNSEKSLDICIQQKEEQYKELSSVEFSECTAVLDWTTVESNLQQINKISVTLSSLPGECTFKSGLIADIIRKCLKEGVETLENEVEIKSILVLNDIKKNLDAAISCVTLKHNKATNTLKEITNVFNKCVSSDENSLQDVVNKLEPKINEIASTINKLSTQSTEKIASAHSLLNEVQAIASHSINTQKNVLYKAAQSAQIPGLNIQTCVQTLTDSLSGMSQNELNACYTLSLAKLGFLEKKVVELANYQSEVQNSLSNCVAEQEVQNSINKIGIAKVDVKLVQTCVENILETVQSKIIILSNEIATSIEVTITSCSGCTSQAKDVILDNVANLGTEFNTCVKAHQEKIDDVIGENKLVINKLKEQLREISSQANEALTKTTGSLDKVAAGSKYSIESLLSMLPATITDASRSGCFQQKDVALSSVDKSVTSGCQGEVNWNYYNTLIAKIKNLSYSIDNISDACQNQAIASKCFEESIDNIRIEANSILNSVNSGINAQRKKAIECIRDNEDTILEQITAVINIFHECINGPQETIVDIIGQNKLRLNHLKSQLREFASQGKSALTHTTNVLDKVAASATISVDSLLSNLANSVIQVIMPERPLNNCVQEQKVSLNSINKSVISGCQGEVNWNLFNSLIVKFNDLFYSLDNIADKCDSYTIASECFEAIMESTLDEANKILDSINSGINAQRQNAVQCIIKNEDTILNQITKVYEQYHNCVKGGEVTEKALQDVLDEAVLKITTTTENVKEVLLEAGVIVTAVHKGIAKTISLEYTKIDEFVPKYECLSKSLPRIIDQVDKSPLQLYRIEAVELNELPKTVASIANLLGNIGLYPGACIEENGLNAKAVENCIDGYLLFVESRSTQLLEDVQILGSLVEEITAESVNTKGQVLLAEKQEKWEKSCTN